MGGECYTFMALYSSGNAIVVTNKDIIATRCGGTREQYKDYEEDEDDEDDEEDEDYEGDEDYEEDEDDQDLLDDPLGKEDVEWLLGNSPGYNAYQIGESFVLFTKGNHNLHETPTMDVVGPYELEDNALVEFRIEEAPMGKDYTELLELAGKFTPPGSKLSFAPGKYTFVATVADMIEVKQLNKSDLSSDDTSNCNSKWNRSNLPSNGPCKRMKSADDYIDAAATVPFDFELIVGNGDKKKTIEVNRALLLCSFPHLETMVGDALTDTKLELPKLDAQATHRVLEAFSSRMEVGKPYDHKECVAFEEVQKAFGKSMIEMAKEEPPTKGPRLEHPAIADSRWLDASFLCGLQREEIKVNRSALASMNPVLHRILFGAGLISVDPTKPIEWPDFDASAVRQVFLALLHCGKKEFVVPMESVESAKMLVDHLMETRESLMLYYDTPFKREYQGRSILLTRGEDRSGLKFT